MKIFSPDLGHIPLCLRGPRRKLRTGRTQRGDAASPTVEAQPTYHEATAEPHAALKLGHHLLGVLKSDTTQAAQNPSWSKPSQQ